MDELGAIACGVPGCPDLDAGWGVCLAHEAEALGVQALLDEADRIAAEVEPARPIKIAAVPLRWQPAGGTPYGRAVLARAVEQVAVTECPGRNETLNRAAFLIGGYVAGGEVDMPIAVDALMRAADACGLPIREASATIRRSLHKGLTRPLMAPSR